MGKLNNRKRQRLQGYDYSQSGAYFITICTQNRLSLFGEVINGKVALNSAGIMIEENLLSISNDFVKIDKYCIMPNHVHILMLLNNEGTTQRSFPTLSDIVRQFKTVTTSMYILGVKNGEYLPFEKKIRQKSFYDHIMRKEHDYEEIWQYIDTNPQRWELDLFCTY